MERDNLQNEAISKGGVPFDGVLTHWSDGDFELMERVVVAIEVDLDADNHLRTNLIIARFCALLKSFQDPVTMIAPHLTWKDGDVVACSADLKAIDIEFRSSIYAMAALLPEVNEAARLLEASGISVWSRDLD